MVIHFPKITPAYAMRLLGIVPDSLFAIDGLCESLEELERLALLRTEPRLSRRA
ncbi:hypothetical protein HMPREF9999_01382 [Alloprevotella sp. oral taxon 473 str. F0040]|nr:hypothetical protein HMPREF9999_01382 [Alloprevotella sp. oral taxon 473 str. F0040]